MDIEAQHQVSPVQGAIAPTGTGGTMDGGDGFEKFGRSECHGRETRT